MNNLDRRNFLKSLGMLSLAMVPDISRRPIRKLFPLLIPAEEIIPGTPYWYASTCCECPARCGTMLKVREGRVIKIEGNPNHPLSRGGLCPRGQAALQELYNVDRIRFPFKKIDNAPKTKLTWDSAINEIKELIEVGKTLFISGYITSIQKSYIQTWLGGISEAAQLFIYEPALRNSYYEANRIAFGRPDANEYHLENADLIMDFGAEFMETWESPVELSHQYSNARRVRNENIVKLIYVGISESLTGTNADEEYKIHPKTEAVVMLSLANWLLDNSQKSNINDREKSTWRRNLQAFTLQKASEMSGLSIEQLTHLGKQLDQYPNTLILCGDAVAAHEQGTDSIVAANILNYICGSYGNTIALKSGQPLDAVDAPVDFEAVIEEILNDQISNIIFYNTNPFYTYPDKERLRKALKKVPLKIALATTLNDTAAMADYVLPVHHTIETWGVEDLGNEDYSLVQPGMQPVFDSKPVEVVLQSIRKHTRLPNDFEQYIENEWQSIFNEIGGNGSFEKNWKEMLLKGGVWNRTTLQSAQVDASQGAFSFLQNYELPKVSERLTLNAHLSHRYYDGVGANKSWLWELPHQLYHYVWDVPVRVHPNVAREYGLAEGEIVSLSCNNRSIEAPVLITDQIHPKVIAMELGSGHANYGQHAVKETGNPADLLPLNFDRISGDKIFLAENVEIKKTGKRRDLVRLQGSYDQGERKIVQQISLKEVVRLHKQGAVREEPHAPKIYPEHEHEVYDWMMVIDLSLCTGCGACAVACYAENAVPVVGKQGCKHGREMAWLRLEKFEVDGRYRFIPMLCQQCEIAPCETVCPVYATVHSNEGLNIQVYNRCVGTRYCSNNCPYKVRRFNYYPTRWEEPTNLQLNPDIYHRPKGVMEKCTFCVHRLRRAKEEAKMQGRLVKDGEAIPACVQSCPTGAMSFGNLNNPDSRVTKMVNNFRGYHVFEVLNTQPSVLYLKNIKHEDKG
ncbi:molybdopterin-dependent oxidoreductase [candidate division KSB1 bacterium]|nr:molybdopterin-dependent oxidoreductase [candidate division KSB1 bacterium]